MMVSVGCVPVAGATGAHERPRRPEEQPGTAQAGEDGRGEGHHRWGQPVTQGFGKVSAE